MMCESCTFTHSLTSKLLVAAKETGGLHIDAEETAPDTYFQKIADELRTSYEVAYYPTNKARDDSFQKIAIRSKLDGVKIRSKTGYFGK